MKRNLHRYLLTQIQVWLEWDEKKSLKSWVDTYSEIFCQIYQKFPGDWEKIKQEMIQRENHALH